jgi:HEAT repeat protein
MLRDISDATIGRPDITATFPQDYAAAIEPLISSPDPKVRQFAASAASAHAQLMPDALRTVPALLSALEDQDAEVRRWAASSLAGLSLGVMRPDGTESIPRGLGEHAAMAVDPMLRAIPGAERFARMELFSAIGNLGDAGRPAVPTLVRFLSSDERIMRVGSLRALEGLGTVAAEARQPVARLLRENAGPERTQAGKTLMAIQGDTP